MALGLPPLMIDTPWFLGPEVARCGMPGEHVHLHNAPCCLAVDNFCVHVCCYEASGVCIAMRQAVYMCFAMRQWKL